MKTILILFATREGHTRRIAEGLSAAIHSRGQFADVINAAALPDRFRMDLYGAAIVAASVHAGKHEPEVTRFVQHHREDLERIPAAFLSVTLSEAGAEDEHAPPEIRAKAKADTERLIDEFLAETGWHPAKVQAVAGALLYTKYNFFLRIIMKRIAQAYGGSADTSRDHVYTNWEALDHLAGELVAL